MRFRPEQHLRRPGEFRAVREQGRRLDCGAFMVWHLRRTDPAELTLPRVGVVASTSAVGHATERNRAKRRLREIFRQHQGLLAADSDVLLVARAAVNRLDFPALELSFANACRKLLPDRHA